MQDEVQWMINGNANLDLKQSAHQMLSLLQEHSSLKKKKITKGNYRNLLNKTIDQNKGNIKLTIRHIHFPQDIFY